MNLDEDLQLADISLVKLYLKSNVEKSIELINRLDNSEARNALTDIVLNIENIQNVNELGSTLD